MFVGDACESSSDTHLLEAGMRITGNILAIVAIVANAIGNYYIFRGQRRSQIELLKLDQELNQSIEARSAKRAAYADLLAAIEELYESKISKNRERKIQAEIQINKSLALVDIIGPAEVYLKASDIENFATLRRSSGDRNLYLDELTTLMRVDLKTENPEYRLNKYKD